MREIIFRIWNTKTNNMLYDSDFIYINSTGEIIYVDWDSNRKKFIMLNNLKLMQFTGLKDKNDKEIYEGDIIDYDIEYWIIKFNEGAFHLYRIEEDDKLCADDTPKSIGIWAMHNSDLEVIGNIYENPELLEKK